MWIDLTLSEFFKRIRDVRKSTQKWEERITSSSYALVWSSVLLEAVMLWKLLAEVIRAVLVGLEPVGL
jgi:hypothetical protein